MQAVRELLPEADGFVVHQDLEAFYISDERRRRSREVDYGVWWTLPAQDWPYWRVSWVEATGEFYAVAQLASGDGTTVAHAGFPSEEAAEAALAGWEDHCHEGGLGWVWARLVNGGI
jgi:hypothetical protein